MLGDSSVLGSSGGGGDNTTAIRAQEGGGGGGGVGSNSGEEERSSVRGGGGEEGGDRSFGGNRWPRQETLALLKIRSDMDVAFRDASVKGPLWEEVSRKLAELGYHRSAKKCKEKFENVYKYHRRTKEGRTGKSYGGKTYRFFDQLEALENQPPTPTPMSTSASTHQQPKAHHQSTVAMAGAATTMAAMAMTMSNPPPTLLPHSNISTIRTTSTVPSAAAAPHPIVSVPSQGIATPTTIPNSFPPTNPTILPPPPQPPPTYPHQHHHATFPSSFPTLSADLASNYSTSSSTSSDEELEGRAKRKRKRKWKDFFERLMKEVIQKQEELQQRFLEAIEKREHERMVREEAWRMQEMTRINREREILAQERSITAAKDAAVMSFLQKISEQQPNQNPGSGGQLAQNTNLPLPLQPPPPPPQSQSALPPPGQPTLSSAAAAPPPQTQPPANNGENINFMPAASSSRWPKVEVQALIKLRTSLDSKYQENGPKGPLWEEISAAMRKLGYNRNAKRCKEKWENINKYFKKVKESNKRRPEDSKTCPYFHQLDNLYRERNKFENHNSMNSPNQFTMKAENAVPLMVRPEQQWPPQQENNDREDHMESENIRHDHQNQSEDREDKDMIDEDEEEEDEDEDEEEESGDIGNYEIVPNKGAAPPVGAAE